MLNATRYLRAALGVAGLVVAAGLAGTGTAQAAEQIIEGFMAWDGKGTVYETGPHTGTFVGEIRGTLFIQSEKGPAAAGKMICPALLGIDLADATQIGVGSCIVTGDDGAKVYADWSCHGVHLIGCDGEIKLTGGTGRLQGISGTGKLSVRTIKQVSSATVTADGALEEIGSGLLMLKDLKYSLPQQ